MFVVAGGSNEAFLLIVDWCRSQSSWSRCGPPYVTGAPHGNQLSKTKGWYVVLVPEVRGSDRSVQLTHLKENIVNAVGEILNPGATTNVRHETSTVGVPGLSANRCVLCRQPVDVRHAGPASSSRVGVKDTTKADATRVGISEDDEIDVGFHNAREEWDADEHWAPENPIEPGLTTVHDRETTLARSLANQQADPLTAFVSGSEATGQLATQVQGDQLEYRQTKDNAARGSDVAQAPSRGVDNGRLLDETIRKAQLHEQRALDLDEQVKRLLLDMHGTNASLQACQRDLADMQSRLDRASNDSRAAVSRRGNQVGTGRVRPGCSRQHD